MKIKSISCPSCGSSLNADENETRVICSFCGCSVIVEDTRQEGYNFELGSMQARANAAQELANIVDELTGPLSDYERVSNEKNALIEQKASLEKSFSMCEKHGRAIYIAIGVVVTLLIIALLAATKPSIEIIVFFILIAAASFPIAAIGISKYAKNVQTGAVDSELAIEAHEKTLQKFDETIKKYPDINIPAQYRNVQAMNYIRDNLKSQQSQTIEQAISQYEDVVRQEKSIALQQEQIRLQKEQLEQSRQQQSGGSILSNNKPTQSGLFSTSKQSPTVVTQKKTVIVKQHGHSIVVHLILCCFGIGLLTIPYYTLSKHHYWHL